MSGTAAAGRRVVIIGPPPTPNGDLHVGHVAGPYLAADIHARYLRAHRRPVLYTTGTDDSQTYVVATARRLGTTPQALCRRSWQDIQRTLAAARIYVQFRWLGDRPEKTLREKTFWRYDHLRAAVKKLGLM